MELDIANNPVTNINTLKPVLLTTPKGKGSSVLCLDNLNINLSKAERRNIMEEGADDSQEETKEEIDGEEAKRLQVAALSQCELSRAITLIVRHHPLNTCNLFTTTASEGQMLDFNCEYIGKLFSVDFTPLIEHPGMHAWRPVYFSPCTASLGSRRLIDSQPWHLHVTTATRYNSIFRTRLTVF